MTFAPRNAIYLSSDQIKSLTRVISEPLDRVMQVVLYEPEIPPNTGSVARLCAATLTPLHLIEPLGFKIDDKHLKRAGLDYWEFVDLRVHKSWNHFIETVATKDAMVFLQARDQILYRDELRRSRLSRVWSRDARLARRKCSRPTRSARCASR